MRERTGRKVYGVRSHEVYFSTQSLLLSIQSFRRCCSDLIPLVKKGKKSTADMTSIYDDRFNLWTFQSTLVFKFPTWRKMNMKRRYELRVPIQYYHSSTRLKKNDWRNCDNNNAMSKKRSGDFPCRSCKRFGLVCWFLWHINPCRLFNAKSIFM